MYLSRMWQAFRQSGVDEDSRRQESGTAFISMDRGHLEIRTDALRRSDDHEQAHLKRWTLF